MYSYETTKTGANIMLGGYNETHKNGNFTTIKSSSAKYWNTTLTSLNFGTANLYQSSASSQAQVYFQTSYRYIGLPKNVWYDLCA